MAEDSGISRILLRYSSDYRTPGTAPNGFGPLAATSDLDREAVDRWYAGVRGTARVGTRPDGGTYSNVAYLNLSDDRAVVLVRHRDPSAPDVRGGGRPELITDMYVGSRAAVTPEFALGLMAAVDGMTDPTGTLGTPISHVQPGDVLPDVPSSWVEAMRAAGAEVPATSNPAVTDKLTPAVAALLTQPDMPVTLVVDGEDLGSSPREGVGLPLAHAWVAAARSRGVDPTFDTEQPDKSLSGPSRALGIMTSDVSTRVGALPGSIVGRAAPEPAEPAMREAQAILSDYHDGTLPAEPTAAASSAASAAAQGWQPTDRRGSLLDESPVLAGAQGADGLTAGAATAAAATLGAAAFASGASPASGSSQSVPPDAAAPATGAAGSTDQPTAGRHRSRADWRSRLSRPTGTQVAVAATVTTAAVVTLGVLHRRRRRRQEREAAIAAEAARGPASTAPNAAMARPVAARRR